MKHTTVPERRPDDELARAIRSAGRGEAPGVDYLWNRFSRAAVAYSLVCGDEEAVEVVAAAFERAVDQVADLARPEDFARRLISCVRVRSAETGDRGAEGVPTGLAAAMSEIQASALLTLDPDDQHVLLLRVIPELSRADVAIVLGRSEDDVAAIEVRVLRAIRDVEQAVPTTDSGAHQ